MLDNSTGFNYLMLSDVHLGSDLVQHAAPWTAERLASQREVDHQLVAFLSYYRARAEAGRPWKLILVGDIFDLVGMSVAPVVAQGGSPPKPEDLRHGLGNASDQSAEKMRHVVERHRSVFAALGAFVQDGHHLVMVRGNHDVEFYWESVQAVFVSALIELQGAAIDLAAQEGIRRRVEFHDWFYYEPGMVYVEHGHQYDETCSYHHQLAPLCPDDPSRLSYSFSDILMRYIVRPTRGLSSDGHENQQLSDYVKLAVSLGVGGCVGLSTRFGRALGRMLTACRSHAGPRASSIGDEQERRLRALADARRLAPETLRALADLAAKPVTGGLASIVRSVFLDGVAAIGALGLLIGGLLLSGWLPAYAVAAVGMAGVLPVASLLRSSRVHDPDACLRAGAAQVAKLFPAAYVVMGHTHQYRFEALSESPRTTYINLGWWAGDECEAPVGAAPPRSYLVLRWRDGGLSAVLVGWDAEEGPRPLWPGRNANTAKPGFAQERKDALVHAAS